MKLKKCSKCGNKAFVKNDFLRFGEFGEFREYFRVGCMNCGNKTLYYFKKNDAIKGWNEKNKII